jgi:NAD(P)-dependent dehydrogenase (short-subunit alcohol dehydrogenase family)
VLRTNDIPSLTGKTILVTGASSGIGRAAALRLAAGGATVLVHGRSTSRTSDVARAVGTAPLIADFSRLADVRRLADAVQEQTGQLDAILHNAGGFHKERVLTVDGHESTFQTNYLAPFLLQLSLNRLVVARPGSRVVVTTSSANRIGRVDLDDLEHLKRRYRGFYAYAGTKLLSILFVAELRRRFASTGLIAAAVHPGAVGTRFGAGSLLPEPLYRIPIKKRLLIGLFVSTPEQGAAPLVRLAADPDRRAVDHLYFDRFVPRSPAPQALDAELAVAVWERSLAMVQRWLA